LRGGAPVTVSRIERDSEAAGLLRIDFPGYSGKGTLQPIDWDEFEENSRMQISLSFTTPIGKEVQQICFPQ